MNDLHTLYIEAAHWAIDQGADLFAGHGPHFLRGIEIYKNRPIFYSLGNFIFQNGTWNYSGIIPENLQCMLWNMVV